jgi:hypothetical protein
MSTKKKENTVCFVEPVNMSYWVTKSTKMALPFFAIRQPDGKVIEYGSTPYYQKILDKERDKEKMD